MAAIQTSDTARLRELADFLRSRRERLSPEAVGLPRTGRRRTPGLRREELATLAGVGVTWYTWLEQGRSINASSQVLGAIASALRLDGTERTHLFTLAGVSDPVVPAETEPLSPAVHRILDALMPNPAYVLNERWDVLAWNTGAARMMIDFGAAPPARRNIARLMFGHPELRARILDWDHEAARHVAMFRGMMAAHSGEPAFERLRDELYEESPEFRKFWDRHEVARPEQVIKRFSIPGIGTLRLQATSMWLVDRPGARMIVYVGVDDESTLGLHQLADRPSADGDRHNFPEIVASGTR